MRTLAEQREQREVFNIAFACHSLREFYTNHPKAYDKAKRQKWLPAIKSAKNWPVRIHKHTQDEIRQAASQCRTRRELKEKFPELYRYAGRKNWTHLWAKLPHASRTYPDVDEAFALAKSYDGASKLRVENPPLYQAIRRYGLLGELKAYIADRSID